MIDPKLAERVLVGAGGPGVELTADECRLLLDQRPITLKPVCVRAWGPGDHEFEGVYDELSTSVFYGTRVVTNDRNEAVDVVHTGNDVAVIIAWTGTRPDALLTQVAGWSAL